MALFSRLVHKFFDIREGELTISLWMQLYIFLIICALLVVKPTINALFLSTLGADDLAVAFIIIAAVAVIISYLYNKSLERFPLRYIMRASLGGFAICFFLIGWMVFFNVYTAFLVYLFYIVVGMFALLATSQFWVMANVVYNVREAKRLFGFIGSGGIAGSIAGGYLTSILAPHIGNGLLIVIASVLVGICVYVLSQIWKTRVNQLNDFKRKERATVSTESSLKLIYNSKHLTYLAAMIGVGVLVAKLVDYQFSYLSSIQIPDAQDLASFFGFWFSTFNILSLVVQLVLTRYILERADISIGLISLPIGLILSATLLLIIPELWIVIILKGLDGSLKQSLHKSALELLSLPIPSDVKNKTKTFIDVVVDSLATGIAGIFIIFIVKGLDLPIEYITGLIIIMIALWIWVVLKVRDTYLGTFKSSIIKREQLKPSPSSTTRLRNNINVILSSGSDHDLILLLDRMEELGTPSLRKDVLELLNHPNNEVKTAVIRNLDTISKKPQPQVQELIYSKDEKLITAAMEYLLGHEKMSYQFFEVYLDYEDEFIARAALLCLAKESRDNARLAAKYNLDLRISIYVSELEDQSHSDKVYELVQLIESIGYLKGHQYDFIIKRYLKHINPLLKNAAIHAAGNSKEQTFIPLLINELDGFKFKEAAIQALIKYGNSIIGILEENHIHKQSAHDMRLEFAQIYLGLRTKRSFYALLRLTKMGSYKIRTNASDLLFSWKKEYRSFNVSTSRIKQLINSEAQEYRKLLSCYLSLKVQDRSKLNPEKTISLPATQTRKNTITKLDHALELSLKRIFNLLALRYRLEDVFVAYKGLKSDASESRVHAIEYLDGILGRSLKTTLLPLIETGISAPTQNMTDYHKHITLMHFEECITTLINTNDPILIRQALHMIDAQSENVIDRFLSLTENTKPNVQLAAQEALARKRGAQVG